MLRITSVFVVFGQQSGALSRVVLIGESMMNRIARILAVLLSAVLAAGCANQDVKPGEVICPILGAVAGGAIAAGAFNGDDNDGAIAGGAALGAGLAWFLCREEEPAPPPAPRKPAPKPKKPQPPKDSDGDGVIDPNDECPGTPAGVKVNAVGCPEVGETILSLEGVNFDTNKATIKAESEGILNNAVKVLSDNVSVHVRVEGHTDSRGSDAHNQKLSQRRAEAVAAYLSANGIDPDRLSAIGYGESAPVAPNDTAENMYKNRRVDLVVTDN